MVLTPSLHASPSRPSRLLGSPPHPSRYEACCTIAFVWSNRAAPRSTCTALLGRQKLTIKKNLRKFCGFAGGDVELKKKAELLKKMDGKLIKKVLEVCDLQLSGTKAESIDRLLAFLSKPEASGARRVQTVGRAGRGGESPLRGEETFLAEGRGAHGATCGPHSWCCTLARPRCIPPLCLDFDKAVPAGRCGTLRGRASISTATKITLVSCDPGTPSRPPPVGKKSLVEKVGEKRKAAERKKGTTQSKKSKTAQGKVEKKKRPKTAYQLYADSR